MKVAVCAVQVPFVHGGAEILCESLHGELLKRGYETVLVKVPFKWYPPEEIINGALVWRLLDLAESNGEKIDRVICTKFPSYVAKHHRKIVWLLHQHRPAYDLRDTEYDDLSYWPNGAATREAIVTMDNITLREAQKVYSISQNVASRLRKYNHLESTVLYPPPADMQLFHCEDFGDFVLCPGFDAKKRAELLIQALKYVKSSVNCKIVGRGLARRKEHLAAIARECNVAHRVELLDLPRSSLIDLYARALCVFYGPFDEDYGYVVPESFLSCKPAITTKDSGGPLEFVQDFVNGFVIDPDARAIAEKIDFLYDDKGLARKMGMAGRSKVDSLGLSWDGVVRALVES